jgi:hypothetical protein
MIITPPPLCQLIRGMDRICCLAACRKTLVFRQKSCMQGRQYLLRDFACLNKNPLRENCFAPVGEQ